MKPAWARTPTPIRPSLCALPAAIMRLVTLLALAAALALCASATPHHQPSHEENALLYFKKRCASCDRPIPRACTQLGQVLPPPPLPPAVAAIAPHCSTPRLAELPPPVPLHPSPGARTPTTASCWTWWPSPRSPRCRRTRATCCAPRPGWSSACRRLGCRCGPWGCCLATLNLGKQPKVG